MVALRSGAGIRDNSQACRQVALGVMCTHRDKLSRIRAIYIEDVSLRGEVRLFHFWSGDNDVALRVQTSPTQRQLILRLTRGIYSNEEFDQKLFALM